MRHRLALAVVLLVALAGLGNILTQAPPAMAEPVVVSPTPVPPPVEPTKPAPEPQKPAPEPAKEPAPVTPEPVTPAKPATPTTPQPKPAQPAPAPKPAPTPQPEPVKPQGPRLAILVYHDVDDYFQSAYTVTPAHLEAQIQMLLEEGYTFYRLNEVERLLSGGEGLPEKGVMLAFDDGYQSYATQVLPLARKYNVPAVCFVVTKYMAIDIIFGRPHMSEVELKQVVDSGLLELASHSHDSHRTGLAADGSQQPLLTAPIQHHLAPTVESREAWLDRMRADFTLSKLELRKLGVTTGQQHFTFPFTARSPEAVQMGQEAGFRYFYVGGEQLVTPDSDPTAIPRVHAGAPYITADVLRETLRRLFVQP